MKNRKKFRHWKTGRLAPLLRYMPRFKHLRGTWIHRLLGERIFAHELWHPERRSFARGCAIGTFFSLIPVPGQMPAAAAAAYFLRGNVPTAIALTWISNPFTIAFLLWFQYMLGRWILGLGGQWDAGILDTIHQSHGTFFSRLFEVVERLWIIIKDAPEPFIVGTLVTIFVFTPLAYIFSLCVWEIFHFLFSHHGHEQNRQE